MVQDADPYEPATGVSPVTATRSIDDAAYASCANTVSEIGNGTYVIDLAASDLNGDSITFKFTGSGAKTRKITVRTEV